jgi:hypothetical protein
MLRRDQHASAARRYDMVRRKFKRAFGQEPGFALSDLLPRSAAES